MKWLVQWLIRGGFIDASQPDDFDPLQFIDNCQSKLDIFDGLCIDGLCLCLDNVDRVALAKIGYEYARRHLIVPIMKRDEDLYVATCDPFDFDVVDDIRHHLGLNVVYRLTSPKLIRSFFGELPAEQPAVAETVVTEKEQGHKIPIDHLFEYFTELAVGMRASDIHFERNCLGLRIRFRIDGKLRTIQQLDENLARAAMANIKLRAKLKLDETRLPQDGRLKIIISGRSYDMRLSIIPNIYGENAVLRLFNADVLEFSLHNLGLSEQQLSCLKFISSLDSGLVLISGPTGSGKTTTMYSLLKHISSPSKKVITIEDPIENLLPNISQVSVGEKIGLTFNHILRAVLRQSPNVIFIGEIRDSETAQSVIQAALTGHLVLSTVHSGSAEEAITRLRDLGISEYLIDSCVRCVIFQTLMRLKCEYCQENARCDKCFGRRYYGRTGVFEILINSNLAIGKSPSKFNSFEFLCTMVDEIARLRKFLYEGDYRVEFLCK
jgi:type II secretory ATPase GspE/PulE/Tfp pilus assembly ATPase PilB-like protein